MCLHCYLDNCPNGHKPDTSNSERHDSEWTSFRMDTIQNVTQSQMDTNPNKHNTEWKYTISNGYNPEWTQSRMDIIPNGHHPKWTRSQLDTISIGHHPLGSSGLCRSRMDTIPNECDPKSTRSRMDMIPNGHNSE